MTVELAVKDVESAVEGLQTNLTSIEKSINNLFSGTLTPVMWLLFFYFVVVDGFNAVWHSKYRYGVWYSIPTSRVYQENKPHDCEFLSAPLGDKHCSYDRKVTTLEWSTSTTGDPIESMDGGTTWTSFAPPDGVKVPKYATVREVYVGWEKKNDE